MLLLLLLLASILSVQATEDWWNTPRQESLTELRYVGVAEGPGAFEELKDKAFIHAARTVVREHFGATIEATESVLEDAGNSNYQVVARLKSDSVIIKGMKVIKVKEFNTNDDKKRVYVLLSVTRADLERAISRGGFDEITNTYGVSKEASGSVVVKTHPSGALIEFTGEDFRYSAQGHGNAKFYLPIGRYSVFIHRPGHRAINLSIRIDEQEKEISEILEPLYGKLTLETHPADAKVEALAPIKGDNPFYLHPEKNYRFKISHPDYYEQTFEIQLPEEKTATKVIHLDPRPSTLKFKISPVQARLVINGKEYSHTAPINIDPSSVAEIRVSLPGYNTHHITKKLKPNRIYSTEIIKLTEEERVPSTPWFTTPSIEWRGSLSWEERSNWRFEYNPGVFTQNKLYGSIIPLGLFYEWKYLSLGAHYNFISYTRDENEDNSEFIEEKVKIEDFSLNARIFLPKFHNKLDIYFSGISGGYTEIIEKETLSDTTEVMQSFKYFGLGAGIRVNVSPKFSVHAEVHQVRKTLTEHKNLPADESMSQSNSELKGVIGMGWDF